MNTRSTIQTKDKIIDIGTLINIHDGAIPYFEKLHKRGTENERYYSADPFDDKQKAEYASQDRIPFSISSIPQKLNSIIASERQQRISWKCRPFIQPEDISDNQDQKQQLFLKETKANLATIRMKAIEAQNNLIYKMSDVFASGIAVAYGAMKVRVDNNRYGDKAIFIDDVDYKNLIWDVNSTDYEHNDAQWMAEKEYIYRVDLKRQYGDKVARNLTIGDAATRFGRKKTQYYVNYNKDGNSDLDLLTVINHYHKTDRTYYVAILGGSIITVEPSKSKAEYKLNEAILPYLSGNKDIPPSDVVPVKLIVLDKYRFTYTDVLEYDKTDLEIFPYSIYQAFQFKDKIWTMSDVLKSMQQLANRLLAQIDYAFGIDLKNNYEIFLPALEGTGYSMEEAMKMLKEKGFVPTMQKGIFTPIPSQGANPQWAQIMELMLRLIDETSGGTPMGGTASGSNQSAKAIQTLIMQGQMLTNAFIDNKQRFMKDLGKKLLWFMKKYDSSPYIMRIEGGALSDEMLGILSQNGIFTQSLENPTSGYVNMNVNGENYLESSDYDLDIIEESTSDNKKEMEFTLMTQLEQADPELKLSSTWRKKKIEKINSIGYEDRVKIIGEIQQAQQMQQQQAQQMQQQQMNLQKAKILVSDKGNQTGQIMPQKQNMQQPQMQ